VSGSVVARLSAAAKAWERDVVIPHCRQCSRPCCALTDVVLDLSPREVQTLYRIGPSTKAQDLPSTIRRQGQRFFAHGQPCPAFDTDSHRCGVYDTDEKPSGCSDFPVYADGDGITADRRCEAVKANLAGLEDALVEALDDGATLTVATDPDFPDTFVFFQVEAAPKTRASAKASAPRAKRPIGRSPR
jgi:Fe-S-cluster containining protein